MQTLLTTLKHLVALSKVPICSFLLVSLPSVLISSYLEIKRLIFFKSYPISLIRSSSFPPFISVNRNKQKNGERERKKEEKQQEEKEGGRRPSYRG